MNVFLRMLKIIAIAALLILNENTEKIFRPFGLPVYLIGAFIGLLLFFLIAELTKDIILYLYRKRKKMHFRQTDNVIYGVENLYILILTGAFLYFVLYLLRLKPRDFFTGFTLISAATAIIMKDYISNIISGMILAFSDKLRIGDYVKIGRHTGEILNFSLSMISLKNDDDELVYLPINIIFTQDFINYTAGGDDLNTVHFEINHKMKVPFEELNRLLSQALDPYKGHIADSGVLKVASNNQESTTFKYQYELKRPDIIIIRRIRDVILKTVFDATTLPKPL